MVVVTVKIFGATVATALYKAIENHGIDHKITLVIVSILVFVLCTGGIVAYFILATS